MTEEVQFHAIHFYIRVDFEREMFGIFREFSNENQNT